MLEKHKLLNTFSQNLAIMGTTFYFRIAYKCEISIVFWFFKADYIVGDESVGGLIGYSNGSVVSNSYATGAVTGASSVGGLIGYSVGTVTGTNYFVDASGGTNGLGSGTCSGTCTSKTVAQIAALSSTSTLPSAPSDWTTGSTGNWNFGTATQLPAVLYSGGGCETIILPLTNNINSNDGDAKKVDCGDLLPGQR